MESVATANFSKEKIAEQLRPLSSNGFAAFFQKIWRGWLAAWHGFADKHPLLSKIIYMLFFFILFSQAVTVFQFLIFLFLPHAFGMELAKTEWFFPMVNNEWILLGTVEHVPKADDTWAKWTESFYFFILGKPLSRNAAGEVIIGGGLGYFFAFLIATFLAQVINFPLQRNITFRSHGNPVWQALWYLIGWLLIQPFCDMVGSLWKYVVWGVLGANMPVGLSVLLDTVIMGGIAMAIFFVVFLIIFPDYNKLQKSAQKKVDKLKATNVTGEKLAAAEAKLAEISFKARFANADKGQAKTKNQANAKAIAYFASEKNLEKAKASGDAEKVKLGEERAAKKYAAVCEAIVAKEAAIAEFAAVNT